MLLALKQSYNNDNSDKTSFWYYSWYVSSVNGPRRGRGGHYAPVNVIPVPPVYGDNGGFDIILNLYSIAANSLYQIPLNIVHTRSVESPRLPPPRQRLPMSNPPLNNLITIVSLGIHREGFDIPVYCVYI